MNRSETVAKGHSHAGPADVMKTSLTNSLGAALGLSILLNANAADSHKLQPVSSFGAALRVHSLSGNPISFSALTHGNGIWVAASGDTIFTSTDSTHWSSSRPFPDVQVRGLAFDGNQFVAVGAAGLILTSPDAVNWTRHNAPITHTLWAVAAGDGELIAVGSSGTILGSTNGMDWTTRMSGVGDELRGVCYSHGRFVAVGCRQTILTSKDGHRWTRTGSRHSVGLKAVAAGSDGFVAAGCGVILTSPDGRSWSRTSIGSKADSVYSVAWGEGRWMAVGKSGLIFTSDDGRTWNPLDLGTTANLHSVHYAQDRFIAVGKHGKILRTGPSGVPFAPESKPFLPGATLPAPTETRSIIAVTLRDIFFHPERGEAWWVLADETGQHGLSFFVGSGDPRLIAFGFRKNNPRPLTFNFFAQILDVIGAELTEVRVVDLVANTFRAEAHIRVGGSEHRVDARPSDAVALAASMSRPIYVSRKVMAVAAKPLGAEGNPPDLPEGFASMRHIWTDDSQVNAP
jgi:bifunctional DNase/RNase